MVPVSSQLPICRKGSLPPEIEHAMRRFIFEYYNRKGSPVSRSILRQKLIFMTANQVAIHCGCARCGHRLVNSGRPYAGARMLYPGGKSQSTAVGMALCGECQTWLKMQ
jgi:hypothetical protein